MEPRVCSVAAEVFARFPLYLRGVVVAHGVRNGPSGPDIWELGVTNGAVLLHTTFALVQLYQAYPGNYPGPAMPARTGANESNTLGYGNDTVYHITRVFDHTADTVQIYFQGSGLQGAADEAWGLDNVVVSDE